MTDAIIEAAARALRDKVGSATFAGRSNLLPLSLDDLAQAVLTAVTPLIEANALERAAKLVACSAVRGGSDLAAAIRALKARQPVAI